MSIQQAGIQRCDVSEVSFCKSEINIHQQAAQACSNHFLIFTPWKMEMNFFACKNAVIFDLWWSAVDRHGCARVRKHVHTSQLVALFCTKDFWTHWFNALHQNNAGTFHSCGRQFEVVLCFSTMLCKKKKDRWFDWHGWVMYRGGTVSVCAGLLRMELAGRQEIERKTKKKISGCSGRGGEVPGCGEGGCRRQD